jgi:hypothetical protein
METVIAFIMAAVGDTANWPEGVAEVVRSVVLADNGTESDTYAPTVECVYHVAGLRHRGTRVRYGALGSSNRGAADRTVTSYPAAGRRSPVPARRSGVIASRDTICCAWLYSRSSSVRLPRKQPSR